MAFAGHSFYRSFTIPKRSGEHRTLHSPLPSLALVQTFFRQEVLSRFEISGIATGFVPGKSILDHVKPHVGKTSLLKIDLKDFFGSISRLQVEFIFRDCGYTRYVAKFASYLLTLGDSLPQGSPSSPALSNAVARRLDFRLEQLCARQGLSLTRYADDIAISSIGSIEHSLAADVESIVEESGFLLNKRKTRLYTRADTAWHLTGLVIRPDSTIGIPKSRRRYLRQQIHYLDKFLLSDAGNGPLKCVPDLLHLDRLRGMLGFWSWVEPDSKAGIALKEKFLAIEDFVHGY